MIGRCSGDGGASWGEARRLNDDPLGNGLSQFMPRLDFSPGGRLDAVFYDRRRHPDNVLNHVYLTSSGDGGDTWAANVRLTRHASSSLVGQRYANPSAEAKVEFGSRLGLWSRPDEALAAWADTRNSRPDSTGQDVFTTVVALADAGDDGSALRLAGAALVVLGAAAAVAGLAGVGSRRQASAS